MFLLAYFCTPQACSTFRCWIPRTGVTEGCEPPFGCWEQSPDLWNKCFKPLNPSISPTSAQPLCFRDKLLCHLCWLLRHFGVKDDLELLILPPLPPRY